VNLNKLFHQEHQQIIVKRQGQATMVLAYHTLGNGRCFGGVRILPANSEEKAFKDALRLSEAMSYKVALINSKYGGCKGVVLMPKRGKNKKFLHDIGTLIEQEKGKFISAIDFGFHPNDAKIIREKTKHILAVVDSKFGQSGVTTAFGVIEGIKTSLKQIYGSKEFKGKSFAVQGLGSVGMTLARELIKQGGQVFVADLDKGKLKEFKGKAKIISPSKILYQKVDVLAPCGPAYIINKNTIPKLKCKIIAGGANCILEDEISDDNRLHKRGILIAPDYVINAGGVIQGMEELERGSLKRALSRLSIISKNLDRIYRKKSPTYQVAKKMAIRKLLK
jgi:leucine dehydrogenase